VSTDVELDCPECGAELVAHLETAHALSYRGVRTKPFRCPECESAYRLTISVKKAKFVQSDDEWATGARNAQVRPRLRVLQGGLGDSASNAS
jgi:hypothetical protein